MARLELNPSGVIFNEELHEYWLDGKQLSGITDVLHRQLYPNEFDGIPERLLKEAADYGTSVHKAIETFDSQWITDGSTEVNDYIELCTQNSLVHEASEYNVSDGANYSSNIDKVYRCSDDGFILVDIKTYGAMTPDKLEKAKWQLGIYRYMFLLQNPDATVEHLYVMHLRNKQKKDGEFDHICKLIEVTPIPVSVCKALLDTDLRGDVFSNPYGIPDIYRLQEEHIRELITKKNRIDEELNAIKSKILSDMEAMDVRTWETETMRLSRKLPTSRTSFNLNLFREENPDLDLSPYERTSMVNGSLTIAI